MALTFGNLLLIFVIVFLTVLVLSIRSIALKWPEHRLSSSRFPNRHSVKIIFGFSSNLVALKTSR